MTGTPCAQVLVHVRQYVRAAPSPVDPFGKGSGCCCGEGERTVEWRLAQVRIVVPRAAPAPQTTARSALTITPDQLRSVSDHSEAEKDHGREDEDPTRYAGHGLIDSRPRATDKGGGRASSSTHQGEPA